MVEEKKTRKKYRRLTKEEIKGIYFAEKAGFLKEYLRDTGIARQRADYHLRKSGQKRGPSYLTPGKIRSTVPLYNELLPWIPSSARMRTELSKKAGYNINYAVKRMAENQMLSLGSLFAITEVLGLKLVLKERGDSDDAV